MGNAEAAAAGVLERARPELLLKALAHRLQVDPQRRRRVPVDPGQADGDTRPERLLDGIRAAAELPQAPPWRLRSGRGSAPTTGAPCRPRGGAAGGAPPPGQPGAPCGRR